MNVMFSCIFLYICSVLAFNVFKKLLNVFFNDFKKSLPEMGSLGM